MDPGVFVLLLVPLQVLPQFLSVAILININFATLQHEFQRGSRSTRALVRFILDSLEVNLYDLWEGKNRLTPSIPNINVCYSPHCF